LNTDYDWYVNVCHSLAVAPNVKGCGNAAACQVGVLSPDLLCAPV